MKNEIQEVSGFKYDGVIYDSKTEAENAMNKKLINDRLHIALDALCIYGEYRFDNIEILLDELNQEGLEITLKKQH